MSSLGNSFIPNIEPCVRACVCMCQNFTSRHRQSNGSSNKSEWKGCKNSKTFSQWMGQCRFVSSSIWWFIVKFEQHNSIQSDVQQQQQWQKVDTFALATSIPSPIDVVHIPLFIRSELRANTHTRARFVVSPSGHNVKQKGYDAYALLMNWYKVIVFFRNCDSCLGCASLRVCLFIRSSIRPNSKRVRSLYCLRFFFLWFRSV